MTPNAHQISSGRTREMSVKPGTILTRGQPFLGICGLFAGLQFLRGRGSFPHEIWRCLLKDGLARTFVSTSEEPRMYAQPHHHEAQGHHDPLLAVVYVRQRAVLIMSNLAEENALVRPQEIAGREDYSRGAPGGPLPVNLVGAEKDE